MKFCSDCGAGVSLRIPDDDDRHRYICDDCDTIHYQNPRVIVGCLPVYEGKILLCKRAIQPRHGYWTLPAGFMENGESTLEGAARETWEEARAKVHDQQLYRIFDMPQINQVYMFYRCELSNGEYGVGPESTEVELFSEDAIPWRELAFLPVIDTLKEYFEDRKVSNYPVRVSKLVR
ncbi:MAG: ADP-ribose pyrophosphatase YjhB (NUDIX family) [Halieaceae bacterium]|jgi:ADP-ribose pyrophosphatase YjhB (NUDIX family)